MAEFHRGFEKVDQTNEERAFFRFLDLASNLPSIAAYRDRMLELCPVTEGCRVLDIGCGIANEALRLARLVGSTGRVQGIDTSQSMIAEARHRAQNLGLPVAFDTADAHDLPFDRSAFDVTRAERVLLYLGAPDRAIGEMARVTRPGGRIVVFDFDYAAFFLDSDFAVLTRRIEALLANDPRNPAIARALPHLMRGAGLMVNAIVPMAVLPTLELARRIYAGPIAKGIENGDFSSAEIDAWWREQAAREQAGKFYHAHQGYIVAATKPA